MKKKLKPVIVFALCITLVICSNISVFAGTMGSIPIVYNDTNKSFTYDVDGYINAGETYILPNPFDADDEYDFLIPGSDASIVFANFGNNYVSQVSLGVLVYSTSGTLIKQYRKTSYNTQSIAIEIPPQGANRNFRITISPYENTRIVQYGVVKNN